MVHILCDTCDFILSFFRRMAYRAGKLMALDQITRPLALVLVLNKFTRGRRGQTVLSSFLAVWALQWGQEMYGDSLTSVIEMEEVGDRGVLPIPDLDRKRSQKDIIQRYKGLKRSQSLNFLRNLTPDQPGFQPSTPDISGV